MSKSKVDLANKTPGQAFKANRRLVSDQMERMAQQLAALRKQVEQLRQEAAIERMPVSKTAAELTQYCLDHTNDDALLVGVAPSENPFKENKSCSII